MVPTFQAESHCQLMLNALEHLLADRYASCMQCIQAALLSLKSRRGGATANTRACGNQTVRLKRVYKQAFVWFYLIIPTLHLTDTKVTMCAQGRQQHLQAAGSGLQQMLQHLGAGVPCCSQSSGLARPNPPPSPSELSLLQASCAALSLPLLSAAAAMPTDQRAASSKCDTLCNTAGRAV